MEIEVCIDGILYNLDKETQTAMVISPDNEEDKYRGEVVIPEVVVYEGEGYAVTEVANLAFSDCSGLTSIIVSEGVINIGDSVSMAAVTLHQFLYRRA